MFELGASEQTIISFLKDLDAKPKNLIDFVIRYGKGLEEPAAGRELTSAPTIGASYFLGGFVPLLPYFFTKEVGTGLIEVWWQCWWCLCYLVISNVVFLWEGCPNHKNLLLVLKWLLLDQ